MTLEKIIYKNYIIEYRTDVETANSFIYTLEMELVKCIAGDVKLDKTNNKIEKAKAFIDSIKK